MKSEGGFRKNEFGCQNLGYKPVISIITVVFNNVEYIEKTILSAVNQIYLEKEYIIIDGGSTDGTLEVIKKYNDHIDYWISEPDKGIYDAMNKGLYLAKGEYVLFLNSGDLLVNNDLLERIFSASVFDADVYYGETNLMNSDGILLGTRTNLTTRKLPKKMTWKDMKWGMVVSHQSIIVKRTIAPQFNLKYKVSADIDWVIECLKKSKAIVNVNAVISNYLIGGVSIKNQKRSWRERFTIYLKHYGLVTTLFVHFVIIIRNMGFKLKGRKNY